jgi:hypothetical protein
MVFFLLVKLSSGLLCIAESKQPYRHDNFYLRGTQKALCFCVPERIEKLFEEGSSLVFGAQLENLYRRN